MTGIQYEGTVSDGTGDGVFTLTFHIGLGGRLTTREPTTKERERKVYRGLTS